jgi:hypothetical protein
LALSSSEVEGAPRHFISWADAARLEAREGALGKPDQSINIVRLRRQDAMAPFSIVFFEQSLKANRRLIRDENRLVASAFGAQPKELSTQADARVGSVILALQKQHRLACGRIDPIYAAGPSHSPAQYYDIGFMIELRLP